MVVNRKLMIFLVCNVRSRWLVIRLRILVVARIRLMLLCAACATLCPLGCKVRLVKIVNVFRLTKRMV